MVKKSAMDRRWDAFERKIYEFRVELRNQRNEWHHLMERLERCRRHRGRSRPHEESGETVEPTTMHIKMRKSEEAEEMKSEEVEEKMVGNDWEGGEKDCTFDKEPDGQTFETKVGEFHPLYDAMRSFTAPLYDTYPDEEETKSRIDWGRDLASDKEPPPEENADEATADVVVPDCDMREGIFSLLTGSCEGEEKTIGSAEKLRDDEHWGRPPEKNTGGATTTVEAEGRTRELGASFFSFAANNCDREGEGKNVAAEWSSRKVGLNLMLKPLGQAQMHFLKPAHFNNLETAKKGLVSDGVPRLVNPISNVTGQAQTLLYNSTQFINLEGVLQEEREVKNRMSLFPKNPQ